VVLDIRDAVSTAAAAGGPLCLINVNRTVLKEETKISTKAKPDHGCTAVPFTHENDPRMRVKVTRDHIPCFW